MRLHRVLGSLLLVAATGTFTVGATTVTKADPTPLDRVVPAPASVTPGGSPYRITGSTAIRVDDSPKVRRIGEYLADILRPSTGYRLPLVTWGRGGIQLRLTNGRFGAEGYRLDSSDGGVTITATEPAGLFHGVQTLRRLLPAAVEKHSSNPARGSSRAAPSRTARATATAARCSMSPATSSLWPKSSGTSTSWPSTRSTSCICTSVTTRAGASPSAPGRG